jgi:hypothetical protein
MRDNYNTGIRKRRMHRVYQFFFLRFFHGSFSAYSLNFA